MPDIRVLERADVADVARVYADVVSGRAPSAGLRAWIERTLLDHPWVDEEVPSLVAADDDGRVVGFLGSHVRRLRVDGRPARLGCSGQLVVEPGARRGALGALLLRRYLAGPQDLTITDGATETIRAMWELLGGDPVYLGCIEWVRPLRPWGLAKAAVERRSGRPAPPAAATATSGLDRATVPVGRLLARAATSVGMNPRHGYAPTTTEPLDGQALVDVLPELTARLRVRPEYDPPFAGWLLAELAAVPGRGTLRAALVRDAGGALVGFFVYFLQPGGLSAVVSIGAATEEAAGRVLAATLDDARAGGASALHGRLEPRLVAPARRLNCLFYYHGGALIHGRDPALVALATSRHAHLTRLEGESWMAPQRL